MSIKLEEGVFPLADVNKENEVAMIDILLVYQYFRGMITEFAS